MQLPIGYDDFGEIVQNKLNFIDKSLFIKEILDDKNMKAIVITRPRRFGKTLNLSLLHYFLASEVYGQPTKGLFEGLNITRCSGDYMQHQGKYPVVSITFKDVKEANYTSACVMFARLMSRMYFDHKELLSSNRLASHQKETFKLILEEKASEALLKTALFDLTHALYQHHDVKPWLLIDEYDTPIQEAYAKEYYDQMIEFMRGLLSSALKSNPYLNKAVITGILRVAKESLFSGVNNLKVYSILHPKYSEYFGFTESEVDYILKESHLSEKADDIKAWYNGYQFGNTTIYNPWSIANCIKEQGATEPYWINVSDNQLIKHLLKDSSLTFKEAFESLVAGHTVEKLIDEQLAFQYLSNLPDATWSLLLMAGYLKPTASRKSDQGTFVTLAIPNREVRNLYRQIIEQWLSNGYGISWYNEFIASLLEGKMKDFEAHLQKVLLQITSCHDLSKEPEAFYHGLLLGFLASLHQTYEVKSNRESGLGRFDILMIPKDKSKAGVVIELKIKDKKETLEACAHRALEQIEQKQYLEEFKQCDIEKAIQIGIGFKGKIFALDYKFSAL